MNDKKFKPNVHIILLAIIIFIIIFCAVRLYIWNKGTDSEYDPNAVTTEFDTEPLDVIFQLLPDKLEGHEDDGVNTVLCLGNDVLTDGRDDHTSFSELVAADSNSVVYNGGFAGSTLAAKSAEFIEACPDDAFTFYYVADAISKQDFSLLKDYADKAEGNDNTYADTISTLETLDMSTIDTLVIFYDANDMLQYRAVIDPENPTSLSTFCGALSAGISEIQEAYPYIRIVVMSPYFGFSRNSEGYYSSLDTEDFGNGNLPNYLLNMIDTTQKYGVSIIDNYYGTITETNSGDYLTDNIHLNSDGREVLAKRLIDTIGMIAGTDDAESSTEETAK
ncbi:MAG: hypothetical protein PHP50_08000 [Lachnospiraceae bacterium]|nr:hypothetical protein [Lachnospiraceae bacterium]